MVEEIYKYIEPKAIKNIQMYKDEELRIYTNI